MPILLVAIAAGGALGAAARFTLAGWINHRTGSSFPWGTLAVNLSGSFALGLLLPLFDLQAPASPLRAFLTVGLLGAFTTFSSFAIEALTLLRRGEPGRAAVYVAASLLLGLGCIAAGLAIGGALR